MDRLLIACVLLQLFVQQLFAQKPDSVYLLKGVEIQADRVSGFQPGIKIEKFDSTIYSIRQGASVATLLSEQSPVFLRSYGPGGICTLSVRGTTSTQSAVFWNGINLNQPNLGMTDLSRISTFEFDGIALHLGGGSSFSGSGMFGGSLSLENKMDFLSPPKTSVLLSAGSAGKLSGALKASAGNRRIAYTGSFSGEWNKNNFRFDDENGDRKRLEHALVKSASSIHQAEFILNKKQRLSAGVWVQATDRQIPPTMTMAKSDQQQSDLALRGSLQWAFAGRKQSFVVRTAIFDEKEHFESKTTDINTHFHTNTCFMEVEGKRNLGKHFNLEGGINGRLLRADITDYKDIEYQKEGSARFGLAFKKAENGIKAALMFRQDVVEGYKVPFCPAISGEIPFGKGVASRFLVSRNFRIPTMNDKFWFPGGNPDLVPESSWNQEIGISFDFRIHDFLKNKISLDFYNILIDNLIQWVPGNSGFWSPQNVKQVWSRGMEFSAKSNWKVNAFKGYFSFAYNFSPSSIGQFTGKIRNTDSKQLIYIPLHKLNLLANINYKNYYALLSNIFTGKRYVQNDNAKSLPGFFVMDFYTGKSFVCLNAGFRVQLELHNVFDTKYQSVQYYPEPGRSFFIQFIISTK